MSVVTALLVLHSLVGVSLLGVITHQLMSVVRRRSPSGSSFVSKYAGVNPHTFTQAVISLYVIQMALGAILYPSYRMDVRIPFEEMSLGWAIGLFEVKEHLSAIGLGILPLYNSVWRTSPSATTRRDRMGLTVVLAIVVWSGFLSGHILNNIRGLN